MQLTQAETEQLNKFENFAKYRHTWESLEFLKLKERTIALFTGNRRGKGAMVVMNYNKRIQGTHPVPEKNILYFKCANGHEFAPFQWLDGLDLKYKDGLCPKCAKPNRKEVKQVERITRTIRFAGDVLPSACGGAKVKNIEDLPQEVSCVQWIELLKWTPHFLIKTPPSTRSSTCVLHDPYGVGDITVEFFSYNMPVRRSRGHERLSIWSDELGSEEFYDEQEPRLLISKGDHIITYTVTEDSESTVLFDRVYDQARIFIRSKAMVEDYYLKYENRIVPQIEKTNSPHSIAVVESATQDNPILTAEDVEEFFSKYPDPDVRMMRQYCRWKQLSAKIFPQFDWGTHVVDTDVLFAGKEMYN